MEECTINQTWEIETLAEKIFIQIVSGRINSLNIEDPEKPVKIDVGAYSKAALLIAKNFIEEKDSFIKAIENEKVEVSKPELEQHLDEVLPK